VEIATSTAGTLEPEPPPLALALAIVAEAQLRGPRAVDLAERAKFSISAGTGGGDGTAQLHYKPLEAVGNKSDFPSKKEFYNKTPSHNTGHGTGAHWH